MEASSKLQLALAGLDAAPFFEKKRTLVLLLKQLASIQLVNAPKRGKILGPGEITRSWTLVMEERADLSTITEWKAGLNHGLKGCKISDAPENIGGAARIAFDAGFRVGAEARVATSGKGARSEKKTGAWEGCTPHQEYKRLQRALRDYERLVNALPQEEKKPALIPLLVDGRIIVKPLSSDPVSQAGESAFTSRAAGDSREKIADDTLNVVRELSPETLTVTEAIAPSAFQEPPVWFSEPIPEVQAVQSFSAFVADDRSAGARSPRDSISEGGQAPIAPPTPRVHSSLSTILATMLAKSWRLSSTVLRIVLSIVIGFCVLVFIEAYFEDPKNPWDSSFITVLLLPCSAFGWVILLPGTLRNLRDVLGRTARALRTIAAVTRAEYRGKWQKLARIISAYRPRWKARLVNSLPGQRKLWVSAVCWLVVCLAIVALEWPEQNVAPSHRAQSGSDNNTREAAAVPATIPEKQSERPIPQIPTAETADNKTGLKKDPGRSAVLAAGYGLQTDIFSNYIARLKDTRPHFRVAAAEALGEIKDRRAVDPLIAALEDTDSDVRSKAAEALGEIKDRRAVDPLIAALEDTDSDVRSKAAGALGEIKDRRVVDPLIAALKDTNSNVRSQAANALGGIEDPRTLQPLIAALKDTDSDVRLYVVSSLSVIKTPSVLQRLIAALEYDKDHFDIAASALGEIAGYRKQTDIVNNYIAWLKDTRPYFRAVAAWALGEIEDRRAVDPLIAALKDTDSDLRRKAAEALGKISLGEIKDRRAVDPLIAVLKDTDSGVRREAAWALGEIEDGRAVDPLIAALKDTDSGVRSEAAEALGKIKDGRAVDSLIAALKDTDSNVRRSAAEAFSEIKVSHRHPF